MDFGTAWTLTYTQSGLAWIQTIGSIFIIFAYLTSSRQTYWNIVLVHGLSGLLGTAVENTFLAKQLCCKNENWAVLLGLNEICWIVHEITTVLYSIVKLEIAIPNEKAKRMIRGGLGLLVIPFVYYRILIGIHRVNYNTLDNERIAKAHSNAFVIWGIADVIVLSLLVLNTVSQVRNTKISTAYHTLLETSLPKLLIISINTFLIVILGQTYPLPTYWANLNQIVWAIKGTYPMILLLDIMATKQAIQSKSTTATYEEPTANLSAANKVYDLPIPELSLRSNGSH